MPNYVFSFVRLEGDQKDIDALKNSVKSVDSVFDFNQLIPMPASLDIESGSRISECVLEYLNAANPSNLNSDPSIPKTDAVSFANMITALNNVNAFDRINGLDTHTLQEPITNIKQAEYGKIYVENLINYGHMTWYGWRCEHWNTKWNACDPEYKDDHTIAFSTAWSPAVPIIRKLAELNPNVKITFEFYEEFIGASAGVFEYENGIETKAECYGDGSKNAVDLSCRLCGCLPSDINLRLDPYTNEYVSVWDESEILCVPKHKIKFIRVYKNNKNNLIYNAYKTCVSNEIRDNFLTEGSNPIWNTTTYHLKT